MVAKDLIYGIDGDLLIDENTGDFVIRESDEQHIEDILFSNKGEFKEFPTLGLGILSFLSGSNIGGELNRETLVQLESDGYTQTTIKWSQDSNQTLTLDTDAKRV